MTTSLHTNTSPGCEEINFFSRCQAVLKFYIIYSQLRPLGFVGHEIDNDQDWFNCSKEKI